ncbi:hypothetical protein Q9L58_000895 [Maublancomyces gigas]|uniref:Myb/SANT-like domain-containing protein n=1 Tax=Discina gigas TaxID=1032678 RepID=A0ABR3GVX0_9PEZI
MTRKGKEKDATKPDRATWSSEMEKLLIKALLVEIQAGRKAENGHGMTKEGWMNAHAAFNKHSKQPLELMQIKNKANALKKEYAIFSAIKESGEFAWDDATGTPTASNEVWDRYIDANPIAKKYRGRNLNHFPLLSLLVSDTPFPAHHALTLTPDSLPPPITTNAIATTDPSSTSTHKRPRSPDDEDDSNEDDYKDAQEEEEVASYSSSGDDDGAAAAAAAVLTPGPKTPNGTHPDMKRLKRSFNALRSESATSNIALANALTQITQITQQLGMSSPVSVSPRTGAAAALDNVQAAIATLQNDYEKKMSVEDLVIGLSIFESEHKAKMFVAMKKGLVRDAWLMKEIRVYRGERGDL